MQEEPTTSTEAVEAAEAEKVRLEEYAKKEAAVAKQVQTALETENMALQPFLHFSENGIVPRVRLVENELPLVENDIPKTNDEQETNTGAIGKDTDEHESVDAKQS